MRSPLITAKTSSSRISGRSGLLAGAVAVAVLAVLVLLGPGGTVPASAAASCNPIVKLVNTNPVNDNYVVALSEPYGQNNRELIIWSFWGGLNQQWCVSTVAGPDKVLHWQFRNAHPLSGKCLAATTDFRIVQQTCTSASSSTQLWDMRRQGLGSALVNVSSKLCLDVKNKNTGLGAKLQLWSCSGAWNQGWYWD